MNTSYTQVSIGDNTLTFDQYRAITTRIGRVRCRNSFIQLLTDAFHQKGEIIKQIRRDADSAFEAQTEGMIKEFPKRLTKKGLPDRRLGMRPNPEYTRIVRERDRLVQDIVSKLGPVISTFQFPYQFEEVFSAWEEAVETPEDQLHRLLSGMDWYYNYSDDHSVYLAGQRRMDSIVHLVRKLGPDAQLAFNRACPWLNEDGTRSAA